MRQASINVVPVDVAKVRIKNGHVVSSGKSLRVRTFLLDTGGSVDRMSPSFSALADGINRDSLQEVGGLWLVSATPRLDE